MDKSTNDQQKSGVALVGGSRSVAVLLATYNGERYLDEQIRSVLAQTYRDFVVLVRDDNSSDRTPEILARWSTEQPSKIFLVRDDDGNLGCLGNFSRLMEVCDTPYFAFCDQDDVWLPRKIELLMNEVGRLEAQFGTTTPILVHSDLKIVGENLEEICPSLFGHRRINRVRDAQLRNLIFTNIAVGCASVGNRALLELARPIPQTFPIHDWWIALLASSCGIIRTIDQPTVLYRQHGRNEIGAGPAHGRVLLWDARHILMEPKKLGARLTRAMRITQCQSNILLRVGGSMMTQRNRKFLDAFCFRENQHQAARLPRLQRLWHFSRFVFVCARVLPLAMRWCY